MKNRFTCSIAFASILLAAALISAAGAFAEANVAVPWNGMDIGKPAAPGSSSEDHGTFTLTSGGAIGGDADTFQFVYQAASGDFSFVARVASQTSASSQAALMVRDALAATSNFVAIASVGKGGTQYEYRTLCAPGTAIVPVAAAAQGPTWLRLVKRGSMVDGYAASDVNGAAGPWKRVGAAQPTATGMIYVGLCAASSQPGTTTTAVFDHVSLSIGPQPLLDTGTYVVAPVSAPGLVLDAAGTGHKAGTTVDIATPTGAANQKWVFVDRGRGVFDIHPSYDPTLSLTVANGSAANGTKVILQPDTGAPSQLWTVASNPNDTYSLLPQCAPGQGLDDFGGNQTPGFPQDIWQYNNNDPHLQWNINPTG